MKMTGNTILITGGSSGIGLEFAKQFLALGNTVIITGRNQEKLDKVKAEFPGIATYQSDASKLKDIKKLVVDVTRDFPALNVLFNNAGVMKNTYFYQQQEELETLNDEILINLCGPISLAHEFIPHLRRQKEAAIVNITSLLGIVPIPLSAVYCAAKAGLSSFTTSLRVQLKKTNIKVFEIAPPATETEIIETFDPEDVKDLKLMSSQSLVSYSLAKMKTDTYQIRPGQTAQVYFLNKFVPGAVLKLLSKSTERKLAGCS